MAIFLLHYASPYTTPKTGWRSYKNFLPFCKIQYAQLAHGDTFSADQHWSVQVRSGGISTVITDPTNKYSHTYTISAADTKPKIWRSNTHIWGHIGGYMFFPVFPTSWHFMQLFLGLLGFLAFFVIIFYLKESSTLTVTLRGVENLNPSLLPKWRPVIINPL